MKSKRVVYVALISDLAIAVTKFTAATVTGSSAMISEGIHSVIDTISQVLLLWGIRKSKKRPDEKRPFGYGKELYFWSFMVSLIIFILGGCISFYEGFVRVTHPFTHDNQWWNYLVLGIALLFTAVSGVNSLRVFNRQRGDTPFWQAIRESRDPAVFIVLLGDVGDLLGLLVALAGILATNLMHDPVYDGIASMIIGLVLLAISIVLVRESWSLLMGEATSRKTVHQVIKLAEGDVAVVKIQKHFSMYLAPEEIVLQLLTVFKKTLTAVQITEAIARISERIREEYPRFKQIFIEPVAETRILRRNGRRPKRPNGSLPLRS